MSALKSFVVNVVNTLGLFSLLIFLTGALCFVACCITLVSQFCLFCDALFCAVGFRPLYVFSCLIVFSFNIDAS